MDKFLTVCAFIGLFAGYIYITLFVNPASIFRKNIAYKKFIKTSATKIKTKKSIFRYRRNRNLEERNPLYIERIYLSYYNYYVAGKAYTKVLKFIGSGGVHSPLNIDLYYSPKNPKKNYTDFDGNHSTYIFMRLGCLTFFIIWVAMLALIWII